MTMAGSENAASLFSSSALPPKMDPDWLISWKFHLEKNKYHFYTFHSICEKLLNPEATIAVVLLELVRYCTTLFIVQQEASQRCNYSNNHNSYHIPHSTFHDNRPSHVTLTLLFIFTVKKMHFMSILWLSLHSRIATHCLQASRSEHPVLH